MSNFSESWDKVEAYYSRETIDTYPEIGELVKELREHGYDKEFEAITSVSNLILRPNKPNAQLIFDFWKTRQRTAILKDIEKIKHKLTPEKLKEIKNKIGKDERLVEIHLHVNGEVTEIVSEIKYTEELEKLLVNLKATI